jgi:hypothetical protein
MEFLLIPFIVGDGIIGEPRDDPSVKRYRRIGSVGHGNLALAHALAIWLIARSSLTSSRLVIGRTCKIFRHQVRPGGRGAATGASH